MCANPQTTMCTLHSMQINNVVMMAFSVRLEHSRSTLRTFVRLFVLNNKRARQSRRQIVRIQSNLCEVWCEENSRGLKIAVVKFYRTVLTREQKFKAVQRINKLSYYQVATVAHKIVRAIKSVIETKLIFVFTLFAINELILKGF